MPSAIKCVIFDMDGLMLDTEPIYWSSMQQAAAELGYAFDDDIRSAFVGRSISAWKTRLLETFGDEYPRFRDRRRELWEEHVRDVGVDRKAGLDELLDHLDQDGLTKAIATSSTRPDAMLCLGALANRFDAIVTGEEVKNGKPAPDIFLLAARRVAMPPDECLVIEDSESGAIAALAANMRVILVPDLKQPSEELSTRVDRVSSSLHDVSEWLRVMVSTR